jgi:hypothetical protein
MYILGLVFVGIPEFTSIGAVIGYNIGATMQHKKELSMLYSASALELIRYQLKF